MLCPCCSGEWKIKKVGGLFGIGGKKRQVCSDCGYIDQRDVWVDDEYVGPKDGDPHLIDPKKQQELKDAVEFYDKHRLPCCGSKKFFEGPSGGMCTNIECSKCGAKFNTSIHAPYLRVFERI